MADHRRWAETLGGGSLLVAMDLVVLLTELWLHPPIEDLATLILFMAISGGLTVLFGVAVQRFRMPVLFRSLRARLVLASMLTATLALVNVGFTAVLMFISTHDLVILAGLLGFAVCIAVFVAMAIVESTVGSLRSLSVAVGRISSGELQTPVPVESDDEVGDLAAAGNSMASRFEPGLALGGLSIAKGIVEAHGGRIWRRRELGQGSTFSFTLPKRVDGVDVHSAGSGAGLA